MLPPNLLLLTEGMVYLTVATLANRLTPFRYLALTLGARQREVPETCSARDANLGLRVSRGIQVAANRLPWHTSCLVRAMAAKWMLRRRGVASTLYLGARHSGSGLAAHAWLRTGPAIVTGGAEESTLYPPVAWFS